MSKSLTFFGMLIFYVSTFGCNVGDFSSSKNSPDEDRPTEDGEPVLGYLTDLGVIEVDVQGDTLQVRAPAGTVHILRLTVTMPFMATYASGLIATTTRSSTLVNWRP